MKAHEYLNLRVSRVDTIAAQQSGLPALFYTVKRCYGDDEASSYLRDYKKTEESLNVVFIAGGITRFQGDASVLLALLLDASAVKGDYNDV